MKKELTPAQQHYATWIELVYKDCCKARGIKQSRERYETICDILLERPPLSPSERAAAENYLIYSKWSEEKYRIGAEPADFFRKTVEMTMTELQFQTRKHYEQGKLDAKLECNKKTGNVPTGKTGNVPTAEQFGEILTLRAKVKELQEKLTLAHFAENEGGATAYERANNFLVRILTFNADYLHERTKFWAKKNLPAATKQNLPAAQFAEAE